MSSSASPQFFLLEETYLGENSWLLNTSVFTTVILIGLEILTWVVTMLFSHAEQIPVKGKHLDKLEFIDNAFILTNKLITCCFVAHLCHVVRITPTIKWKLEEVTIFNTFGSLVAFYAFYDFFYMWFHRILHMRQFYGLIHKHHHRQKAPSRGNLDAINVHPFEFAVGEYLHLLTVYIIPCHIYTVAFFVLAGGILASLNHTRFDINIPYFFSVKVHDVHHRMPESNYGQYTMFWDKLHGSYRDYSEGSVMKASGSESLEDSVQEETKELRKVK